MRPLSPSCPHLPLLLHAPECGRMLVDIPKSRRGRTQPLLRAPLRLLTERAGLSLLLAVAVSQALGSCTL